MIYIKEIINHKLGANTPFEDVAKSLGWTITLNEDEVEKSDIDYCLYEKGFAPMKSDEEKIKERKENFEKEFINTLWGWYRKQPKGYANAPQSVDIIFNMVNVLGAFTQDVSNLMLFYTQPDFSKEEQCTEEWLIANQIRKEPCTKEEFMQFYVDFQTRWANEQYKIEGVSNENTTDIQSTVNADEVQKPNS